MENSTVADLDALKAQASGASSASERAACLQEIEALLASDLSPGERARILMCRSHLHANQWEMRGLMADVLAAMGLFEQAGEPGPALDAASAAAAWASRLSELSLASDLASKCIVGLESVDDDQVQAEVTNRLGIFCYSFWDYDRAVEQLSASLQAAERAGRQSLVYRQMHNLADTLLLSAHQEAGPGPGEEEGGERRRQQLGQAEELINRMLSSGRADLATHYGARRLQAQLWCEQGRPAEALELLAQAAGEVDAENWEEAKASFALTEARCLRAVGRPAEAAEAARRALDAASHSEDDNFVVLALDEVVAAEAEAGRTEAALRQSLSLKQRLWDLHRAQTAQVVEQVWVRAATELARHHLEAQTAAAIRSAEEDALTRVGNRRLLERVLAEPARPQERLALLMIDIDHFKRVNDNFGHEIGDHVLRALGQLLASEARPGQVVARFGGEEFVFCLPAVPLRVAREFGERLRAKVQSFPWDGLEPDLAVTVSIGVANGPAEQWGPVLAAADRALYRAKHEGRNRVREARPSHPGLMTVKRGA